MPSSTLPRSRGKPICGQRLSSAKTCPSSYTSRTGRWRPCTTSRPFGFQFLKGAGAHKFRGRVTHRCLIRQGSTAAPFSKGGDRMPIQASRVCSAPLKKLRPLIGTVARRLIDRARQVKARPWISKTRPDRGQSAWAADPSGYQLLGYLRRWVRFAVDLAAGGGSHQRTRL